MFYQYCANRKNEEITRKIKVTKVKKKQKKEKFKNIAAKG